MSAPIQAKRVLTTQEYRDWEKTITNNLQASAVQGRRERLGNGNYGDVKPCGEGVSELRFKLHGGLRMYFAETDGGKTAYLLYGGDKGKKQQDDIDEAKRIWSALKAKIAAAQKAQAQPPANEKKILKGGKK
jgi:putative addiction module killer protein